jgi:ADP-ribosylglycohydrolase
MTGAGRAAQDCPAYEHAVGAGAAQLGERVRASCRDAQVDAGSVYLAVGRARTAHVEAVPDDRARGLPLGCVEEQMLFVGEVPFAEAVCAPRQPQRPGRRGDNVHMPQDKRGVRPEQFCNVGLLSCSHRHETRIAPPSLGVGCGASSSRSRASASSMRSLQLGTGQCVAPPSLWATRTEETAHPAQHVRGAPVLFAPRGAAAAACVHQRFVCTVNPHLGAKDSHKTMSRRSESLLWGGVLGSAVGLPHRGRGPEDAPLPAGLTYEKPELPTPGQYTPPHGYPPGAWSGAIDQGLLAATLLRVLGLPADWQRALAQGSGLHSRQHMEGALRQYAERLLQWSREGFRGWKPDLQGFATPYEVDPQTAACLKQKGFAQDPLGACAKVDEGLGGACSVLPRLLCFALLARPETAEQYASAVCSVTHRTRATLAAGVCAVLLLQAVRQVPDGTAITSDILRWPLARYKALLASPGSYRRIVQYLSRKDELRYIGSRDNRGGVAATLYAMVHVVRVLIALRGAPPTSDDYSRVMSTLAGMGGASDVNCAMAGALLGAAGGAGCVPAGAQELPHHQWLKDQIDECAALCA